MTTARTATPVIDLTALPFGTQLARAQHCIAGATLLGEPDASLLLTPQVARFCGVR